VPRRLGCLAVAVAITLALCGAWLWRTRGAPHVPTWGLMGAGFGQRVSYQNCGFHTGQDWFAPPGTPVFAVADGTVAYVGPLWLDGPGQGRGPYAIVLDHGGVYTTYSHNQRALVRAGETVRAGQRIAELGDEGYSGLPHLHLEKVVVPWTGDWQQPFPGCTGYVDPGGDWRWW
jgi:murein DD-endopeptidase MepM/ murein hydrolase activator NlpD